MFQKILVINGHGAKKTEKFTVDGRYTIITPGHADDSYILSFDEQSRHLEEITYKNKIWPISYQKKQIAWQHYRDTSLSDIAITPLQKEFDFKDFTRDLLTKKISWGALTTPKHDIFGRGALAVRTVDNTIVILENETLIDFFKQSEQGSITARPLFFCDKELGKIKPLTSTSLSEIYHSIGLIDEFKESGTAIIVATCSPSQEGRKSILLETRQNPMEISSVINSQAPSTSLLPKKLMSTEQIIKKTEILLAQLGLTGVTIIPRVKNFKMGDDAHNTTQPLEAIQLEFETKEQRTIFKQQASELSGFKESLIYEGFGFSSQPIMQLSPEFIKMNVPENLTALLHQTEENVGSFSTYHTTKGPGQNIPFMEKPAQKFLTGLGVTSNMHAPLSKKDNGVLAREGNASVKFKGFDASHSNNELLITGMRIDRLVKSAKVYVNTDIFSKDHYVPVIKNGIIQPQDKGISSVSKLHWQNMAVGVCHVQEIDLLVDQIIDSNGDAISAPRTGIIDEDAPALLLLSSPALNFRYGQAKYLSKPQQAEFIAGMFRNLFHATLREGRHYLAMPAAGLGVFGGEPDLYFSKLMEIAKEFPTLNIIYHPAGYGQAFDGHLKRAQLTNVIRARKDVMFIANELTKNGYPCAYHNPSDADVVYAAYDVGEYWKNGMGPGYVGEEHIGAMTTAPLNSGGLNPSAYENVVEHGFMLVAAPETLDVDFSSHQEAPEIAGFESQKVNPALEKDIESAKEDTSTSLEAMKQYNISNMGAGKFTQAVSISEPKELNNQANEPFLDVGTLKSKSSSKVKTNKVTHDAHKPAAGLKNSSVTEEVETKNNLLITDKLIPLTTTYLKHLKNSNTSSASTKIVIVEGLLNGLQDTQKHPQALERVTNFYTQLNTAEAALQTHRDPAWKRYVKNALVFAGILITGILPGLAALAIYVDSTKMGRSFKFWKSHGEDVVETLKESQPENMAKTPPSRQ